MIVRDVIHSDVVIEDEVIEQLIRTKEFQRLRKIKQLGLSNYIFPCAEHNRYIHSLGVYHLSKAFVEIIENKVGLKFESKDRRAFQIACLLHDVGHGPFSHAAEEFFNYDHEEFSVKIIENIDGEIYPILKNVGIVEEVVAFIEKKHKNKILVSLLSSAIDVDRMDYLCRDAYYSGVNYGNFDLERIKKIIDVDIERNIICFPEREVHTLEDFLMSRYHMFTQVYLNDKSIGYEALVKRILLRFVELIELEYEFKSYVFDDLFKFYQEEIKVNDFIDMDDYKLFHIIEQLNSMETDEELVELTSGLLRFNELVFSEKKSDLKEKKLIWKSGRYEKSIYSAKSPIYIRRENGEIVKLEEVSTLTKFLKDELRILERKKYFAFK